MQWGDSALTAPTTPEKRAVQVDMDKVDPKLREAGEGVESMFVDVMLKAMRDTVPKNELSLDNSATEIYRSMQDSETARTIAHTQRLGIAEAVVAYLEAQGYNKTQGNAGTGGTSHEGQQHIQSADPKR